MNIKTEDELLELAKEIIMLFREAEDHHLTHRCNFQCDQWFKLQNKACLKALDFEYEFPRTRRAKERTLCFTHISAPPLMVVCQTDELVQATRQRAEKQRYQEVNEIAYQKAMVLHKVSVK